METGYNMGIDKGEIGEWVGSSNTTLSSSTTNNAEPNRESFDKIRGRNTEPQQCIKIITGKPTEKWWRAQ